MKDKELEKLGKYQLLKEEIWDHKGQFKKGFSETSKNQKIGVKKGRR